MKNIRRKKIFLGSIFCSLVLVTSLVLFSCSMSGQKRDKSYEEDIDKMPLFQISRGLVAGFNPDLSYADIIKKIGGNKLIFPSNIKGIDDDAFYQNEFSTIPKNVTEIYFTNPDWIVTIGENAFRKSSIKHFEFPKNLQSIGKCAFCDSDLSTIDFGKSDQQLSLGTSAFQGCPIENLTLPTRIYKMGSSTFGQMKKLKTVDLSMFNLFPIDWNFTNVFQGFEGEQLDVLLKNDAFEEEWINFFKKQGITQPLNITAAESIFSTTKVGESEVILQGFNPDLSRDEINEIFKVKDFKIPSFITHIANGAFVKNNKSTIPSNVKKLIIDETMGCTDIDSNAFAYAPFETVKINYYGTIDQAFTGCPNLKFAEINPPKNDKHLLLELTDSFCDCNKLEEIIIAPETTLLQGTVFKNCNLKNITLNGDYFSIYNFWQNHHFSQSHVDKGVFYCKGPVQAEAINDFFTAEGFSIDYQTGWKISYDEQIFNIKNNVLYGFNPKFSAEEINRIIGTDSSTLIDTLTIPDNIIEVADNAFSKKTDTSVSTLLPSNIHKLVFTSYSKCIKIGSEAFMSSNLQSVILPPLLDVLGKNAFSKTYLKEISYQNCMTTIPLKWDATAFSDIQGLSKTSKCKIIYLKPWRGYEYPEFYAEDEIFIVYFYQCGLKLEENCYFQAPESVESKPHIVDLCSQVPRTANYEHDDFHTSKNFISSCRLVTATSYIPIYTSSDYVKEFYSLNNAFYFFSEYPLTYINSKSSFKNLKVTDSEYFVVNSLGRANKYWPYASDPFFVNFEHERKAILTNIKHLKFFPDHNKNYTITAIDKAFFKPSGQKFLSDPKILWNVDCETIQIPYSIKTLFDGIFGYALPDIANFFSNLRLIDLSSFETAQESWAGSLGFNWQSFDYERFRKYRPNIKISKTSSLEAWKRILFGDDGAQQYYGPTRWQFIW